MMDRKDLIDNAAAMGDRICRQALWAGEQCTWTIRVIDREQPGAQACKQQQAAGDLYQGTAGVAWFLGELARVTGDTEQRRTATAALDHALEWAAGLAPGNFGFHSGRVGVAWAASRLADLLDRPQYQEAAWRLLEPQIGQEEQDQGIDVIGGAAGAIPALLILARTLERSELLESARRLGDLIIARAQREPGGWSWRTMTDVVVRNLNGLAHGASGFGLALLELAAATGEGRYRFAAEMAFLYERSFFDPEARNWPDLRNQALADFQYYGQQETLRGLVAAGRAPSYHHHCMAAWCHGSPGIGLARLRAYELTGQELYREEALAGLPSTLAVLRDEALREGNFSLCHGHFGNCELPLYGARLLDAPDLLESCHRAVRVGLEVHEAKGGPWPTGILTREEDPSLMLGEAGIASFLLRLAEPEIPSPLILRPAVDSRILPEDESFAASAQEAVEGYFGTTLAALKRLGEEPLLPSAEPEEGPLETAPPVAAFAVLEQLVAQLPPARAELFQDSFELERCRFEETLRLKDFSQEFLRQITRPPWENVEPRRALFVLPPGSRLVTIRYDWPSWLQAEKPSPGGPEQNETYHLLFRSQNRVLARVVGPFAALVLDGLEEPRSLPEIVARVAEALDAQDVGEEVLIGKVLPQLQQLYEAGFVDEAQVQAQGSGQEEGAVVAEAG